jgi:hypothetical protein
MTVKELIDELKSYDEDVLVYIPNTSVILESPLIVESVGTVLTDSGFVEIF